MKLTALGYSLAALAFGIAHASADSGGEFFHGAPILLKTVQLHIQGQPVNVQQMAVELHIMNQKGFQPIGLWMYFYVQPDAATGNANTCAQWFNQVRTDESSRTEQSTTRAWMEIHISTDSTPVATDEGYSLTPDAAISCWEAIEFK